MGLEVTELLIAVEETFDIEIDDEASEVNTVGDLYHYVLDRLGIRRQRRRCATLPAFLALRKALADYCGVPEKSIRPETKMRTLVPRWRRQALWCHLEDVHGWELPPLREPYCVLVGGCLFYSFLIAVPYLLGVAVIPVKWNPVWNPYLNLGIMLMIAVIALVSCLWLGRRLSRRALRFPNKTVGATARRLAIAHPHAFPCSDLLPDDDQGTEPASLALPRIPCVNVPKFLKLREVIMELFARTKGDVKLDRKMADLVPRKYRRAQWESFGNALGCRLPELRRSPILVVSLILLWLVAVGASIVWVTGRLDPSADLWFWVVFCLILTAWPYHFLAKKATATFAVEFPGECKTVRDLLRMTATVNGRQLLLDRYGWNERRVWDEIAGMTAKILDVKREEVTESARFIEDLGAGG